MKPLISSAEMGKKRLLIKTKKKKKQRKDHRYKGLKQNKSDKDTRVQSPARPFLIHVPLFEKNKNK